jgi:hypothetical protein
MTTLNAETVQDAMHKQGLKTYQELQGDVKRLELHLDIENANKRFAYKLIDRYEWRYKLWRTVAVTTWVAVLVYVAWNVIF